MDSRSWGPQGDPWWAAFSAWIDVQRRHVKVGDHCFPCAHGSCPPIQAQAPIQSTSSVGVSGTYQQNGATYIYFDMVPVCTVCHEIWERDPEFRLWLRDEYTQAKERGAA